MRQDLHVRTSPRPPATPPKPDFDKGLSINPRLVFSFYLSFLLLLFGSSVVCEKLPPVRSISANIASWRLCAGRRIIRAGIGVFIPYIFQFRVWPKTQIASYGEVPSNAHAKGHATFVERSGGSRPTTRLKTASSSRKQLLAGNNSEINGLQTHRFHVFSPKSPFSPFFQVGYDQSIFRSAFWVGRTFSLFALCKTSNRTKRHFEVIVRFCPFADVPVFRKPRKTRFTFATMPYRGDSLMSARRPQKNPSPPVEQPNA